MALSRFARGDRKLSTLIYLFLFVCHIPLRAYDYHVVPKEVP